MSTYLCRGAVGAFLDRRGRSGSCFDGGLDLGLLWSAAWLWCLGFSLDVAGTRLVLGALFARPRLLPTRHGSQQFLVVFRPALLAEVRLVAPVGTGGQAQADVVLPCVAFVAADHIAPTDLALDAADAAIDGLLVFISFLWFDGLCRCLYRGCGLLAALCGLALWLLRGGRLVKISVPVVALVGAARAACFVCRKYVSLGARCGSCCARPEGVRGAQRPSRVAGYCLPAMMSDADGMGSTKTR